MFVVVTSFDQRFQNMSILLSLLFPICEKDDTLGLAFAITNYFYGEKSVYDCVKRSAIYGRVLF